MSIERLDFKPLTSRMNSTINNIYYSLKLKTELQCQIAVSDFGVNDGKRKILDPSRQKLVFSLDCHEEEVVITVLKNGF